MENNQWARAQSNRDREDGYGPAMEMRGQMVGAALGMEQRQLEIRHELDRLGQTLEGCLQGLDTLSHRLGESVMRGEASAPSSGSNEKLRGAPATALGAQIADMATMAAMVNDRIQSITSRLEV